MIGLLTGSEAVSAGPFARLGPSLRVAICEGTDELCSGAWAVAEREKQKEQKYEHTGTLDVLHHIVIGALAFLLIINLSCLSLNMSVSWAGPGQVKLANLVGR